MSKLNVRANIITSNEVAEEVAAYMEAVDTAKAVVLEHEVVEKLDDLRDEVIVHWATASYEAVRQYEELVKLLKFKTDLRDEFNSIWGRYGLVWEVEMGLDA